MSESLRDLLRQGADTLDRPQLNVDHLVAQVERRLVRRRLAAAAASVAAVVLIVAGGIALQPDDRQPAPAPAPAPTSPIEPQDLPSRQEELQGTYAVPFSGWGDIPPQVAELRAVVTFPAGFQVDDGSTMYETGSGALSERRRLGFWTVDKVASDFCAGGRSLTDPGSTVGDLATTLSGQARLGGTDPIPVTIGGYEGLYVELTRPAAKCPGTVLWLAPRIQHTAYHDRFTGPGDVARLWILDVGGDRVVINTIHPAGATDEDIAELTRIVESATLMER